MSKLTTYLTCTICGNLVRASYEENRERLSQVRFPLAVAPFRCEPCLEAIRGRKK